MRGVGALEEDVDRGALLLLLQGAQDKLQAREESRLLQQAG